MKFAELNESNYQIFAIKFYDNPQALTKEDFETKDKRGEYEQFVNWAREGGAQYVADYYTNRRPITDEEKKMLFGKKKI